MTLIAPLPIDEDRRLARLKALAVLDSAPEPLFDQITQLAADLCGTPIALVSLIDEGRQWFKSNVGLPGVPETPRDLAFCAHTILGEELMEVADATQDPRFLANALVTAAPDIRFYAGVPIAMASGEQIGALCVIDRVPRELTSLQRQGLHGLGRMVATALIERERRLKLTHELAASEASYRLIVEGQSEFVSLSDQQGILSYVNQAYAQFFGLSAQDMVGRASLDFVAPGDRASVADHLSLMVHEGVVARGVNRMVSANGGERWVAWTNRAILAPDGSGCAIHSVGHDITDQMLAEHALAESESRYRMLYESTPAMLHSIDHQGRLLNVSDQWLRKLGYERADVVGRASVDFLSPESRQRASEVVMPGFFKTGRCEEIDYQMVRSDGLFIDVQLSAVLERDAQGQPVRSLAIVQDVTEKKAIAASLLETSHMLQVVLDSLPARISYWDLDGFNRFGNKAFLESFGVTQQSIVGKHGREIKGQAWLNRLQPGIDKAYAGQANQMEIASVSVDGQRQYVDVRFTPDLVDGQVRGLFVFAIDITAHRLAERELADREQRFKLLIDGVRDHAIYMLDAQGNVATWNAGAERNKGYRAEEVLGRHFSLFFTPEDKAQGKPVQELAEAAREGRFEAEDWRLRSDGSRFWASVSLSAIRDEQGELVGFAKITRDLTERKQQEDLLIRVAELAPSAMLMIDQEGAIVLVNAQAEAMFGYPRSEMLGQPLDMLIPQGDRAAFPAWHRGLRDNSMTSTLAAGQEWHAVRKHGLAFPVEIRLGLIDSPQGPAILAAVSDITERRQQQAAAEQALAEKETLLKEVYHRVKNNLQVVQSLLSLQKHALPEGPSRAAIEDSVQRVRAMALVHEKLYQSANLAAVSLPDYTSDLVRQIAESNGADRRMVKLHVDMPPMDTGLDSAVPFGLLLTELISNALKHAFPGQRAGDIWVKLTPQNHGDLLTVTDNGVGLKGEFESSMPSGSMGLKLAASLARQLGGELVSSSDGGTVFSALVTRLRA